MTDQQTQLLARLNDLQRAAFFYEHAEFLADAVRMVDDLTHRVRLWTDDEAVQVRALLPDTNGYDVREFAAHEESDADEYARELSGCHYANAAFAAQVATEDRRPAWRVRIFAGPNAVANALRAADGATVYADEQEITQ